VPLVHGARLPRVGMGRVLVQVDQFLDNHDGFIFAGSNPAKLFKNQILFFFQETNFKIFSMFVVKVIKLVKAIEMKRITICKLAVLFESANRRKFVGQFGSKVASL
jgi:hypothetical protein